MKVLTFIFRDIYTRKLDENSEIYIETTRHLCHSIQTITRFNCIFKNI